MMNEPRVIELSESTESRGVASEGVDPHRAWRRRIDDVLGGLREPAEPRTSVGADHATR